VEVEDLHCPWGLRAGLGSSAALHWFCGGVEMVVWIHPEEWVHSSVVDVLSVRHIRERNLGVPIIRKISWHLVLSTRHGCGVAIFLGVCWFGLRRWLKQEGRSSSLSVGSSCREHHASRALTLCMHSSLTSLNSRSYPTRCRNNELDRRFPTAHHKSQQRRTAAAESILCQSANPSSAYL
jgi:hypothetical protein